PPARTQIYSLSLHDALPISHQVGVLDLLIVHKQADIDLLRGEAWDDFGFQQEGRLQHFPPAGQSRADNRGRSLQQHLEFLAILRDRKSTRLNSSHDQISYAV